MKGPPTASLIAAPAEQYSLCRTKEAERERRAEQFPGIWDNAGFAFPSQSLYVQSFPNEKSEIFNPKNTK